MSFTIRPWAGLPLLALTGALIVGWSLEVRRASERRLEDQAHEAAAGAVLTSSRAKEAARRRTETTVRPGTTFAEALDELGVDRGMGHELVRSASTLFDFRHVRAGSRLAVIRSLSGEFRAVHYGIDADRELRITRTGGAFAAEIRQLPFDVRMATITGQIRYSLFESITEIGEQPELALRLADIFGWDLDFYTDPQPGDTFAIVLEKKQYANGSAPAYGRILAAEYNNAGHPHRAILFRDAAGQPAYFSADGNALRRAFLRSPLKFEARVSSRFSHRRFHPVLKRRRAHLGTDYAAPHGTPVQAIAGGRVTFAARSGASGLMVKLAHANGFESYYLHLSQVFVQPHTRVDQGQRIGTVGSTGLATGPHLDFRLVRNGRFVDFQRLKLPSGDPVSKTEWAAFEAERDRWLPMLAAAARDVAQVRSSASAGLSLKCSGYVAAGTLECGSHAAAFMGRSLAPAQRGRDARRDARAHR